jgi:hypothetical protein
MGRRHARAFLPFLAKRRRLSDHPHPSVRASNSGRSRRGRYSLISLDAPGRSPDGDRPPLFTLDDVTDGRVTAGIGAGGDGFDATALRTVVWSRERTERFEDSVTLLDRPLTEPMTSCAGRWYAANEARAIPGCRPSPSRPQDTEVCGRPPSTAWVPSDSRGAGRGPVQRRAQACTAEGRDPQSLARLILVGPP